MPQYKYPVKGGAKWMTKFNYTDPKSGIVKTAYKRGFDSKREAKKYEDDFIDSLIAPEEDEVEVIRTYGDVFQEYLMSHKRADIKESSLETKFNIFNKHIFPTFEEVPIDSITDDDIANWQKKMKLCIQPNGKHFSEAYLRTIQSQFNSIINYAFSKGYLKANPLADIKNMGIKDKRVEFWTPEEYERFAYHAMEYPQYYYVYEMLYWCGLRLGEMLALTLNDIDLENGIISVTKTYNHLNGEDIISTPKTPSSVRKVSMPAFLCDELKEYIGLQYEPTREQRIFQISKSKLANNFHLLSDEAGLKRITIHGLRHPYVKHTTKIFSLRLMAFQAQAYPNARRKTRGACQLHRGGQSRSPVCPLCNRKRFSCLPPQAKMSWILYAISIRLSDRRLAACSR